MTVTDLMPALMIIVVVLLVGVFSDPGTTEILGFIESGASKTVIMVASAAFSGAALYLTQRSALRTAKREAMRQQAYSLIDRLDRLEKTVVQDVTY